MLVLPGGSIYELAGNVSELVRDDGSEPDACFPSHVVTDPFCPGPLVQIRGGSFIIATASGLRGDAKAWLPANEQSSDVGFRCAYPGEP